MICMTLECVKSHTVWCHTDHSPQRWSEVFFFDFTKMFFCYYPYTFIFRLYFTG